MQTYPSIKVNTKLLEELNGHSYTQDTVSDFIHEYDIDEHIAAKLIVALEKVDLLEIH